MSNQGFVERVVREVMARLAVSDPVAAVPWHHPRDVFCHRRHPESLARVRHVREAAR